MAMNKQRTQVIEWQLKVVDMLKQVFGADEVSRTKYPIPGLIEPDIQAPLFWINTEYGEDSNLERALLHADRDCDLPRQWLPSVEKAASGRW
jgi:hypothetical protein